MHKKFLLKFKNRKSGFSLIVALVLMAMMLLIAISLVSFVVLETQISSYRVHRCQAQTNAITGLRLAMAQLQMLTGDDQRVTATADILGKGGSPNNSLPSGTAYKGKKYWTGVWATGNLDKSDETKLQDWDYASPDKKPFLGWLVSNYDSEAGRYDPIARPINKQTATNFETDLISDAVSNYGIDDNSNELVTLVSAGTLGKSKNWEDNIVRVRRVPIEKTTDYQQPLKTPGAFAYWIGDEGVKARINLPDNYDENVQETKEWFKNFRSTPQRLAGEIIKEFEDLPTAWEKDIKETKDASATKLPYVVTIGDLAQYVEKTEIAEIRNFKQYFHDVSFYSRGVLSDVYNGGLKTDLSVAFEMPWEATDDFEKGFRNYPQFHGSGDKNKMNLLSHFTVPEDETTTWWLKQPEDGLGFVYEFDTKNATSLSYDGLGAKSLSVLRGPTWDVFRNYYRLYKREVETRGYRGFKPASNDSFTAMGIRPYTYVDGQSSPKSESVTVDGRTYTGFFSLKGSPSMMTSRSSYYTAARLVTPMIDGDRLVIPQAMRLAPVILRQVFRFSLIFNQDTYVLCMDPMMVVYNPYNVPIEFFGIGTFFTKYYPVSFDLVRTDNKEWPEFGYYQGQSTGLYKRDKKMPIDLYYYTNNVYMTRSHGFRLFAGTNDLKRAPSGTIRLQPGEVKAVFPASKEKPKMSGMGASTSVTSLGKFTFEQSSVAGYALPFKNYIGNGSGLTQDELENLRDATFSVNLRSSWGESDFYSFYLFYPKGSNDQNLATVEALTRTWMSGNLGDRNDVADENFIQCISAARLSLANGTITNFPQKEFQASPGTGWDANVKKQPLADLNMYKAPADYTPLASPLLTNIRPWVCDPRNFKYENSNVTNGTDVANFSTCGVGWVAECVPAKNEFSPIENLGGNAFWGNDITSSSGQTNIVLFEIPTQPMTSLGQFQSVDASWCEQDTSYIVGNSYPPVALDLNLRTGESVAAVFEGSKMTDRRVQPNADHSFAANLAIWDRYWFSTVNIGDTEKGQVARINVFAQNLVENKANYLGNKRVEFIRSRNNIKRKSEDVIKDFQDPNKVTRNFYYTGMFNVNSTSKEAWKALLGSLHKQFLKIDGEFSQVEDFPIVRFANIIGEKLGGYTAGAGTQDKVNDSFGNEGEGWRWYRSLSDNEIDKLAENIVEEVRSRGPFMSLADFVNRRAYSEVLEHAQKGALQSAIDKTEIINSSSEVADNIPDSNDYKNLIPDNAKATGRAGAPGHLSQGDILSCLGSGMAVRSDTFTIRAYGDISGLDGSPLARAYCEAVVQRTPEWLVDEEEETLYSDDNYTFDSLVFKQNYRQQGKPDERHAFFEKFQRNTKLKAVNRLLGRRYKIVSFRWLTPDEI